MQFNFTGLHSVFLEAIHRREATIAFPLANGPGRFLFLIFIPTNKDGKIIWPELQLFIILARTQAILNFDLKGLHLRDGDFKIWVTQADIAAIRTELGLNEATREGEAFDIQRFLSDLNDAIPLTLPLEEKIAALQSEETLVRTHCSKFVDKALKVHLLGPKRLESHRKPREETLRKLYSLKATPMATANLVRNLKALNWTVSWTDKKPTDGRFEKLWMETVTALRNNQQ